MDQSIENHPVVIAMDNMWMVLLRIAYAILFHRTFPEDWMRVI